MFNRRDLIASLVVFIVAMPLSLGIAMASGASASAGLITAIIGGVVAGSLAGAPLVVTGPAAGLTALVFQLVQEFGLHGLAAITVIAGLAQIVFGLLRTGRFFNYVPKSVLEGMLSAIGFVILLGQTHVLMGADIPKSALRAIGSLNESLGNVVRPSESVIVAPVLICGLLAIAIQLVWPKFKKLSWLPGALPAVIIATLVSLPWEMPRVALAPIFSTMQDQVAQFAAMGWLSNLGAYAAAGVGLAFVASAETLLTARAVDTLVQAQRPDHKPAKLERELFAQGISNMLSGVVGGLPMTGVIVRSAANINSGATSRWSAILHGVWIAAFVVLFPAIVAKVPLTALASVLIITGVKLLNVKHLVETFQKNRIDGVIWLSTSMAIFATDLLKGLFIGLGLAVVLNGRKVVRVVSARYGKESQPKTLV